MKKKRKKEKEASVFFYSAGNKHKGSFPSTPDKEPRTSPVCRFTDTNSTELSNLYKDRDEVNRREFWVCDGWVCDLEVIDFSQRPASISWWFVTCPGFPVWTTWLVVSITLLRPNLVVLPMLPTMKSHIQSLSFKTCLKSSVIYPPDSFRKHILRESE